MRKWYIVLFSIIVATFIIGQICKQDFMEEGTSALHVQGDALNQNFGVEYAINDDFRRSMMEYPDQYDGITNDSPIIVTGKPTGKIFQEGEWFGQEIRVNQVIKGSSELKKDGMTESFYVFSADGFRTYDDGKIRYSGGFGLMQTNSNYILFLGLAPHTLLTPVKGYSLMGGFFGYIKLSNGSQTQAIATDIEKLNYDDVWQFEYIAESSENLEAVYRIKERILDNMQQLYPFLPINDKG
jgi:hypothetical protein